MLTYLSTYWTLFDHLVDYNLTLLIRSCPSCKEKGMVKEAWYQRERHRKKGETGNAMDDHETGPKTEGVFVMVEQGHVGVTEPWGMKGFVCKPCAAYASSLQQFPFRATSHWCPFLLCNPIHLLWSSFSLPICCCITAVIHLPSGWLSYFVGSLCFINSVMPTSYTALLTFFTFILYHSSCTRRVCCCSTCLASCLLLHLSHCPTSLLTAFLSSISHTVGQKTVPMFGCFAKIEVEQIKKIR